MAQKRLVCQVLIFTLMFFSCFVVFDLIAIEYEPNQLTRRSIINAVATVAVRIVKPTLNSRNCSKYINGLLYPQVRGLGNNMFQYAGYLGLTASCSQLCSVISSSEAQILTRIFNNLTAIIKTLNDVGFPKVELQNEERIFDEESLKKWNCSGNITSEDYFQSWRYFHPKLKDQLKAKDFKFNDNILQSVGQFLNDTLVNNNISDAQQTHLVGLHVRKFDPNSYGFLSGTDATFNEGIKRIRLNLKAKAIKAVVYIILSNDATWESKLLPKSPETLPYREILIFSDLNSAAADMALLTKMDSVIVCASGSTFGWWGAYLSSATVYYAKEYASPNSSLYWHTKPEDYFLPEWIPI